MTTKTWTVTIDLDEQGDTTFAEATLDAENKTQIRARGISRRNPGDEAVPQIGDELATARALSDLVDQLLDATASDIEAHTHRRVSSLQV